MHLEIFKQRQEDRQRQLEDLRDGRYAILGQGDTEVLLDGVDEHCVVAEHRAR